MDRSDRTPDVVVGVIGRAHGLSGHVIVHSETDNPRRFKPGSEMYAGTRALRVVSATRTEHGIRVRFEGVDDRTAAEALRGCELRIQSEERRMLDPDEYWPEDLVDLRVFDSEGVDIGVVVGVVEGVGQHRLVIEMEGRRTEVPFVGALVPEVDIQAGHIRLAPVEGLTEP